MCTRTWVDTPDGRIYTNRGCVTIYDDGGGSGNGGSGNRGNAFGSSCSRLVDNLIAIAQAGSVTKGLRETGRDLLKIAFGYFNMADGGRGLGVDGFKSALVSWGQQGHVYRHVYAHAGATLIGGERVLPLGGIGVGRIRANDTGHSLSNRELQNDIAQLHDPTHEMEAAAEINGDNAGRRVGELLCSGMNDKKADWSRIRDQVFSELCDN